METNILVFGHLAEIAGPKITIQNGENTDSIIQELNKKYPAFSEAKYIIAVNKKMVIENTLLTQDCTMALLPPFSGG